MENKVIWDNALIIIQQDFIGVGLIFLAANKKIAHLKYSKMQLKFLPLNTY